ncbi:hypothetical protein ACFV0O_34585 [Kitasatospora sp. NPDC059577]|uniref:hypothetical protein n=1 Tax=Kitasatospora sp. NPDC059577 TaxID=3346873 RepID=UPI0036C36F62
MATEAWKLAHLNGHNGYDSGIITRFVTGKYDKGGEYAFIVVEVVTQEVDGNGLPTGKVHESEYTVNLTRAMRDKVAEAVPANVRLDGSALPSDKRRVSFTALARIPTFNKGFKGIKVIPGDLIMGPPMEHYVKQPGADQE